jgi:hypothetical protein
VVFSRKVDRTFLMYTEDPDSTVSSVRKRKSLSPPPALRAGASVRAFCVPKAESSVLEKAMSDLLS